jgi:hypothetical protein
MTSQATAQLQHSTPDPSFSAIPRMFLTVSLPLGPPGDLARPASHNADAGGRDGDRRRGEERCAEAATRQGRPLAAGASCRGDGSERGDSERCPDLCARAR